MSDPKLVLDFARRNDVKIVDLRFTDLPGLWHHISYPIERLTEAALRKASGWMGRRFAAGRRFMRVTCC